jgi:hypothetical protein
MDPHFSDTLTRLEAEGRATYLKARAAGLSIRQSMAAATCLADPLGHLHIFPSALHGSMRFLRLSAIACAPKDGVGEWGRATWHAYAAGARMAMLELGDETDE